MLYVRQRIPTTTYQDIITELPMINKYFWESRSVYAVEFKENKFTTEEGNVYHEIILTRVEFERNIISCVRSQFCKKYPLSNTFGSDTTWGANLMEAYIKDNMDSRTKEQFEYDFNKVIENLQNLRSK
jgi:hypothetical protein